jgi:hypothetical protein
LDSGVNFVVDARILTEAAGYEGEPDAMLDADAAGILVQEFGWGI